MSGGLVQNLQVAALEAEALRAANASELALTTVSPSYPPLVRDLAHAGGYVEGVAS